MKTLPEEIISSAFVSNDGEFAWQQPPIYAALRAIAETEQAILGGDVWTGKMLSHKRPFMKNQKRYYLCPKLPFLKY